MVNDSPAILLLGQYFPERKGNGEKRAVTVPTRGALLPPPLSGAHVEGLALQLNSPKSTCQEEARNQPEAERTSTPWNRLSPRRPRDNTHGGPGAGCWHVWVACPAWEFLWVRLPQDLSLVVIREGTALLVALSPVTKSSCPHPCLHPHVPLRGLETQR